MIDEQNDQSPAKIKTREKLKNFWQKLTHKGPETGAHRPKPSISFSRRIKSVFSRYLDKQNDEGVEESANGETSFSQHGAIVETPLDPSPRVSASEEVGTSSAEITSAGYRSHHRIYTQYEASPGVYSRYLSDKALSPASQHEATPPQSIGAHKPNIQVHNTSPEVSPKDLKSLGFL